MNNNLKDAGDIFVNELGWLLRDVENAETIAKDFQKNDSYISLAGSIDQQMDYIRQRFIQLERRFDKLCEESNYESDFK